MFVDARHATVPYGGYLARTIPPEDAEITRVGPGTPCGKLMRRYWQPIALSSQLADLPLAIRVLGEDLVLFRDGSERVGLLHRHCSHRGTSLEYGIVSERGIRCCYHGWLFDIDGRVLETPGEPPESTLRHGVFHGAYPAREVHGLVFAYLGPPAERPPFPEFETYGTPADGMVPFNLPQPCNWLQCHENNMDPLHAHFLHGSVSGVQLTAAFGVMPVVDYFEADGGAGMYYVSSRRTAGDRVWVRILQVTIPNYQEIGSGHEDGTNVKYGARPAWNRWVVPVDDTNCASLGWRYFRPGLADGRGDRSKVGYNLLDVGGFQTDDDRTYEERQREPGDWIAQVSQRPIAIHALEHMGTTDAGVAMWRRLLRQAVRGETPRAIPPGLAPGGSAEVSSLAGDTVLAIPRRAGDETGFLREVGERVRQVILAHAPYREATEPDVARALREIERSCRSV